MNASTILLVIALICFFFAAVPLPWANPVALGWLGCFFYGLTKLIKGTP